MLSLIECIGTMDEHPRRLFHHPVCSSMRERFKGSNAWSSGCDFNAHYFGTAEYIWLSLFSWHNAVRCDFRVGVNKPEGLLLSAFSSIVGQLNVVIGNQWWRGDRDTCRKQVPTWWIPTPLSRPLLCRPWSLVYYVILGFNKGFYLTSKGEHSANSTQSIFDVYKYAAVISHTFIKSMRFVELIIISK